MWYIILPRPELIYYVQHHLYAPIGAIAYSFYMKLELEMGEFFHFYWDFRNKPNHCLELSIKPNPTDPIGLSLFNIFPIIKLKF